MRKLITLLGLVILVVLTMAKFPNQEEDADEAVAKQA